METIRLIESGGVRSFFADR